MEKLDRLRDRLNDFVDAQIAEGFYESGDEVILALKQLFAARDEKLAALRAALDEGEASGPGEPFDLEEFLEEMHRSVALGETENKPAAE